MKDRREYFKDYYQKNREKILAKNKEYQRELSEEEKEDIKEYYKEYYKENKERMLELQKKWKEENREKWNEYQRKKAREYYYKNKGIGSEGEFPSDSSQK